MTSFLNTVTRCLTIGVSFGLSILSAQAQAVGVATPTPRFTLEVKHGIGPPSVAANGLGISNANSPTNSIWALYAEASNNSLNFYLNGTKEFVINADGSLNSVSDSTAKTAARPLADGQLGQLLRLQPKSYLYKAHLRGPVQYGFMAQELVQVYPAAVTHSTGDDGKEFWTVNYQKLIPVLVKGMQEQQAQVVAQQAQLDALQAQLGALQAQLTALAGRRLPPASQR